ncbi:baseplate assembly protein, partial [Escherichia coli]
AKGKDVEISNAANITATATGQVKLVTPRLLVTGDVIDNCETNDKTLKELRDAHNEHDHDVKNVQSGDSTITSEKTESQV